MCYYVNYGSHLNTCFLQTHLLFPYKPISVLPEIIFVSMTPATITQCRDEVKIIVEHTGGYVDWAGALLV